MNELMLSIYVPVFNHEKYIEQALDSILMQKTEYSYEVLVGEDCSTDNTRAVLEEYEKKHPGKIKVFYREQNMHCQKIRNSTDLRMRCKGKYLIGLEGDDYWTDPLKIQKQIDFLEKNPDYIGVSHRCVVVDQESKPNGETYQECEFEDYSLRYFVSEIMPGQLTTVMYRNPERMEGFNKELIYKNLIPGDRLIYFALASYGKIYCMQEVMSAYRHIVAEGSSFSANYQYNFEQKEEWNREVCSYARRIHQKDSMKYAKLLYVTTIAMGMKKHCCSKKQAWILLKENHCNLLDIVRYIRWWSNHHIFHKRIWI